MSDQGTNAKELTKADQAAMNLIKSVFSIGMHNAKNITNDGSVIKVTLDELNEKDIAFLHHSYVESNEKFKINCKRSGTGITVLVDVGDL